MFLSAFLIFLPLLAGFCIKFKNTHYLSYSRKTSEYLIAGILFLLGLNLASLENITQNLGKIGTTVLCFFFVISLLNFLTLSFLDKKISIETTAQRHVLPLSRLVLNTFKPIFYVILGLCTGFLLIVKTAYINEGMEIALYVLLFTIGIDLRANNIRFRDILFNTTGIKIAVYVIISSWLAGGLISVVTDIPVKLALSMSSGFGWYSLTGILIGEHYGPVYGTASFLVELFRELLALTMIPLLIKSRPCTSIGIAGATAMDFTLPLIQTNGGFRCVPVALISGFLLSALVPVLILSITA
ncbi:lysine exporter LysO family protein [Vibrio salinus]|uniref:lysine exporter LysO family protein n=1 Tax=Vibrio salinus TaxID=2899784 RepID=UPI001E4C91BD|nr:lysine exporter LysO family protein [Vibrio salinus]MCE0492753.1 lysine exporter LysO family protein [Vibrio salinus]